MNSLEIKDARAKLKKRGMAIIDTCKKEVRDLSEEETKELENIKAQIKAKDEELKELEAKLEKLSLEDEETEDDIEEKDGEEYVEDKEEEVIEDEEHVENKNKRKSKRHMKNRFSLLKAIRSIVNNQPMDEVTLNVIKQGQIENRKAGVSAQGQIQLPTEYREIISKTTSGGESLIATDVFDILKPLRAKNVLAQAGAKFYTNLIGNVQIPVMSKSNVTWEGETAEAKDGAPTFTNVTLSPKRLTAYVNISKTLLAQDSVSAEATIREDLINAINAKLESTILGFESGSTTQPEGIFKTVIPTVISSYADVCKKEADVEDANVLNQCKYIMSPKMKALLRTMPKTTNGSFTVMENVEIDGTPTLITSNIDATKYVFGDFSNIGIGQWGSTDIIVDPYTKASENQIRLVVNMYVDAQVLRKEAFTTANYTD